MKSILPILVVGGLAIGIYFYVKKKSVASLANAASNGSSAAQQALADAEAQRLRDAAAAANQRLRDAGLRPDARTGNAGRLSGTLGVALTPQQMWMAEQAYAQSLISGGAWGSNKTESPPGSGNWTYTWHSFDATQRQNINNVIKNTAYSNTIIQKANGGNRRIGQQIYFEAVYSVMSSNPAYIQVR